MKKLQKVLVLLMVFALCLMVFTACNKSANAPKKDEPQSAVKNPDTMVIAYNDQPTTLDPHIAYDPESLTVISNVYEGLVTYNGAEIAPQLATSWDILDNGKTFIFHLREGVKFTDGERFNAAAVKTNFDRLLTINQGPAWMFDMITNIEVVDELTVKMELSYPFVPFLHALANPCGPLMVSPKALSENAKDGDKAQAWLVDHAVGTGPYILQTWNIDQDLTMVKNANYWGGWEGKHVAKVVIKVVKESSSQRLMIENGDVDFANSIPRDVLEDLKKNTDIQVEVKSTANILNIWLNNQRGALKDPRVRQAIAYGFSYEDCIQGIFGGLGSRMRGTLPPSFWAFDESTQPYEQNVEKAKQLLAEAGYPDGKGLEFTIYTETGSEDYKKVAELFQSDMKEIGIKISIQVVAWATMVDMFNSEDTNPDMYVSGFYPDYLDPDNVLMPNYHSEQSFNRSRYRNAEVDELLLTARQTTDATQRLELYKKAQQIINADSPHVFILIRDNITILRSWVKGYEFHPLLAHRYYLMYKE